MFQVKGRIRNCYLLDSSFSRQSLAIKISLDTSILKEDCPIPKSSKALFSAKLRASSMIVTLFCSLLELFHFSTKASFISVMMTFNAFAMFIYFYLDTYILLPFFHLDLCQYIYILLTSYSHMSRRLIIFRPKKGDTIFFYPLSPQSGERTKEWREVEHG